MVFKKFVAIIVSAVFIASNITPALAMPVRFAAREKAPTTEMPDYKPGEVIVKYKKNTSSASQARIKNNAGVKKTIKKLDLDSRNNPELLELKQNVDVEDAVDELEKEPLVEYAEPNYLAKSTFTPNDPSLANQWGLNNTGQTINDSVGVVDADIDALEAWDVEQGETSPVTVAVIDSGIDTTHPDLSSNLWVNPGEIADNDIDDDSNGYVDDVNGYNFAGISQYYNNAVFNLGRANADPVAQSIKGTGQKLTSVTLGLSKVGSPASQVTGSIRSNLNGADLATFSISEASIPTYNTIYAITADLSSTVTLTNDQTYYIVFQTATANADNYYYFSANTEQEPDYLTNPYTEGQMYEWGGGSWDGISFQNDDIYFATNADPFPRDNNGHGTHVSGIIGATTNNSTGVAGTSPGAKIMALKAGDSSGSLYSSDIVEAINYAKDNGADIINMSFGSTGFPPSAAQQEALTNAYNAGVTLFAASGNSYTSTMSYPAGMANVIGVGSTTNKDLKSSFSTYNSSVDISAPGSSIYATMPTYPVAINGQNYAYLSGTSMASPMAAGVGALVLSKNPSFTPAQLQSRLETTAEDLGTIGRDDSFGNGRVNAYNAVTSTIPPPRTPDPPVSSPTPTPDTTAPSTPSISSYTHRYSSRYYSNVNPIFSYLSTDASGIGGYSFILNRTSTTIPDTTIEGTPTSVLYKNVPNGKWYFHIRAVDRSNLWGSASHFRINIDNYRPRTYALKRAKTKRNRKKVATARLYWKVRDPYTNNRALVKLTIKKRVYSRSRAVKKARYFRLYKHYRTKYRKTRNRRLRKRYQKWANVYKRRYKKIKPRYYRRIKTVSYGWTTINKTRVYRFKTKTRGTYRYYVSAKDKAGNTQRNTASNYIIVR